MATVCSAFTNRAPFYQNVSRCITCSEGGVDANICEQCKTTCHLGHNFQAVQHTYASCACGSGELPAPCRAVGAGEGEDQKEVVKVDSKEGWLEEQGLDTEKWDWTPRWFVVTPDQLIIYDEQVIKEETKYERKEDGSEAKVATASFLLEKIRLVDRAPKSPLFYLFTTSKGVIELRAPSPSVKKEWLLWVCKNGKKKNVVRTFKTIAVRDQQNKDETPLNKQAQKKAQEDAKRREIEAKALSELPIWKHPAYIGHFCDVSFPSISYEKVFTLNDKLEVAQQMSMLRKMLMYTMTQRRKDLSSFSDEELQTIKILPNFLEIMKFYYDDLDSSKLHKQSFGGMSRFLLKFTNALKAMEVDDFLPWVHPAFRNVIFIAERHETSFTFVVVTVDKEFLKFHPFSLQEYPKIKFQNCLRVSDINPVKFLDTSTWVMFFCSKQIDTSLIYDIMLPYFQADPIKQTETTTQTTTAATTTAGSSEEGGGAIASSSVVAEDRKLDFYQTQPRSPKYVFYRTLLCALRYVSRAKGFSKNQQKQLFFALRMSFLDQVEKDLTPKIVTETADRVLIDVGCDQAYRAVDKCFVSGTVDKATVYAVKHLSHQLKSEVVSKLEKDTEERSGFVMHHTTPFVHFHGFTCVADHRDTYKFVDGPIDIIPEMFTNLAPPTQQMVHFNQVFDQIQLARSRCYIMRAKASSSSDAVVSHQIAAMIQHTFTEVIPFPSPRATPAAIFKCPYSTAKDVKIETQREALRSLLEISQNYTAAALSIEFSNSQNHAVRSVVSGAILAVFDAIIRIQASPIPSPVSELLVSEQEMPVIEAGGTSSWRKARTISFKGYWLPQFGFEEKTTAFAIRDPKLLLARDAVLRYFKQSQEAKSPQLFAWSKPVEVKKEAGDEKKKEADVEAVKGDGFDDLMLNFGNDFKFLTSPVETVTANNQFVMKSDDYTIDFVKKLLFFSHKGGSIASQTSDLQRYAAALCSTWEPENVPEFAYYRDVVSLYLLSLQHTGRDLQKNIYTADVRAYWGASVANDQATITMNMSGNLDFGAKLPNMALLSSYKLETSEENLLHQDIDKQIFGDSLNIEEVERLASYLTVEYLRIPLVLEFFSQDRCSSLINASLRQLLEAVLFQPLPFNTDVKTILTIPVPEHRKHEYLGTRFGVLMEEVIRSPNAVLEPLVRIIQGSIKLCIGDYTSLFVPVLLFTIRLALSLVSYFYVAADSPQINFKLSTQTHRMLNTVAENLDICESMLQRWIGEAMAVRDKKHANEFHVHLTLLFASQSKMVTKESMGNFLGSAAFAVSMYHKNMDLSNIPIHDLFFTLQRRRLAVLAYSESCASDELTFILDRMVEVAINRPPGNMDHDGPKWAAVMEEKSPKMCEYKIASVHPYESGACFFRPVQFPGVERIALFFNDLTALSPQDYITIYKDETHTSYWGNEKRIYGGGPWPGAGGRDPLIIPVASFVLYFHSHKNEATTKWGFELIAKAPLSPALVSQLQAETKLSRSACISALADANHDIEVARQSLKETGGASEEELRLLEEQTKPRKLPGLFTNHDKSLQINIQTAELYLHKLGSLRELPVQFSNNDDFETVFKTRDNSNFRCSIKAHDRNRQVVIFNHTEESGHNRYYEVVKWDEPKIVKDTRSLFDMLAMQDRHQAQDGTDMPMNRQLLEADLDGLPEKGFYNMPTRDDTGIIFLGQRFVMYKPDSCGWLSKKFDAIVSYFASSKPAIALVWISSVTLDRWKVKKTKDAKGEEKWESIEPPLPKITNVIGQLLMFSGRPGNFFQVDVLSDKNIHVYVLFEHARRSQRKLIYASDARASFYDPPNVDGVEPLAIVPFSGGKLYQPIPYAPSLVISRDAGPYRDVKLGEEEKETFYNQSFFRGILPDVLVEKYEYWKTGPYTFRGYPLEWEGSDQLLILLQLQVFFSLENGEVVCVNADAADTGETVRRKAAKKLGLPEWEWNKLPEVNARGQALENDVRIVESGAFEWGARVTRVPFSLDKKKVQQQLDGTDAGSEPPLLLMNMLRSAPDSALGSIATLLKHIERFSYLLVWSKSSAQSDSEECEISLVELPRLRMSFVTEKVDDEIRLYSLDYDGLYVDTSFDEVYHKWVGDIPHALVLKNANKESFLLIPNYGLKRVQLAGAMFPTKLQLNMTADWAANVSSRYFVYPVHSSGAFLVTTSTSAAPLLYLIVTHLMTMEYKKCGHLLENCSIEEKLNSEEIYILRQVEQTKSDLHPDACGLRLRLALLCLTSSQEVPFAYKDDYKLYLQNSSHVSSPFRISADQELLLDPPADRKRWLLAVVKDAPHFKVWHRRPPQNSEEMKLFIQLFIQQHESDFAQYEDLREVFSKYLYKEDEPVEPFWQMTWNTLKTKMQTGFDAFYVALEKAQINADEDEIAVVKKEATEANNKVLVRVVQAFNKHLQTFQEKPPVLTAGKYINFLLGTKSELKKSTRFPGNSINYFTSPKPWELAGDHAVRLVAKLLESDLTTLDFIMVYQMLMGHVQPDVLPAKDEKSDADKDDISGFIAYRRPPKNLSLIRLILRSAGVRKPNLQCSLLHCLLHAVERQDTSLFPSFPTITNFKGGGAPPEYEVFKNNVHDACAEYVKRGYWTVPDLTYTDYHPADNYNPVHVSMIKLKDEFQPAEITDMSCEQRMAVSVEHENPALAITQDDLNVFVKMPLNVGTLFETHILQDEVSNSGALSDLPFEIDRKTLSPCELGVIEQMQGDLIDSSKGTTTTAHLRYLNSDNIELLHRAVHNPSDKHASAEILAFSLARLQDLERELETLRDRESALVQQGRIGVEEMANKGTSQLYDESIRLKFEFLIAALLQNGVNLTQYNSKLAPHDTDLIFSCLIGVCFRSIRLAQVKLCLVNLAKLKKAIKQLVASRIEARWTLPVDTTSFLEPALPTPTRAMVRHCLEKWDYVEQKAEATLEDLLKFQKQLAGKIMSEQNLDSASAETVAKLVLHLADFNEKQVDASLDGRTLMDLGRRDCYFNGKTLHYPILSTEENSAGGMSTEAMIHVVQHTSQGLADLLTSARAYVSPKTPQDTNPKNSFDPRFLVFEYVVNFMVRVRQVELVLLFVEATKAGQSSVNQMIMGAGKTTVIAPLLSLILANGENLVMCVIPKPLIDMGLNVMRNVFSNILQKKVISFEFTRSISDEKVIAAMYAKLKRARKEQSIVCCTPESVKALMLKYVDLLEESRASNPTLYIPKRHFGTHYLWETVEKMAADVSTKTRTADILANIICLWRDKGIALLDEVDTLLHPLRSELNFPVGPKENLDLVEHGDRFTYPLFLYDAFFYSQTKRTSVYKPSDEEIVILRDLSVTIEEGTKKFAFQTFPHPILLRKSFYNDHLLGLMSRWSYIWIKKQASLLSDAKQLDEKEMEKNILSYTTTRKVGEFTQYVRTHFSPPSIKLLNLSRDWLTSFIPHSISKINRVDYGLLQESHLQVWEDEGEARETQSKSRLTMAVPFVGKDVPSLHSEFANPEVIIGLTILSYRYQGLRYDDLKKLVKRLKESMQQEPGSFFQRPSRIRFNDWINIYELSMRQQKKKCLKILPLELFPPDISSQMEVLMTAFSKQVPEVVDYWLTQIAFPETLKYQVRKLQASGVDLGSSVLFKTRLGFSGTPSNMLPLELGKCGFEPGCQASIIRVMTSPAFTKITFMQSGWTVESLLTMVATHDPPFHALIDTGALITGFSNKEVAEFLLKVGLSKMECCVYLDDADRKIVINRAGVCVPFARSGVAPDRRFTFFDQVHTTGMDIKQCIDACAATTLGKDMTLRDHSQGIYRMRGLAKGQTVHLLIVPEVLDLIQHAVEDTNVNDSNIREYAVHWLTTNSLRSFNQQYMSLCSQNLNNLWRKEAFKSVVESRQPLFDKRYVTQNRFVYQSPNMSEAEVASLLEKHPLMNKTAFDALMNQYDIDVTFVVANQGGVGDNRQAEYKLEIDTENMLVSKVMSNLLEMVSKDIVNSNDLQLMLIQNKIKYVILDDWGEEIDVVTAQKLKEVKTLCHPKRAKLSEVVVEEDKDAMETAKAAALGLPTQETEVLPPDQPPSSLPGQIKEKEGKEEEKKKTEVREYPHITVKLLCAAKEFATFGKHFSPAGTGAKASAKKVASTLTANETEEFVDVEALLAKMTPEEKKKWDREQKKKALESLEEKKEIKEAKVEDLKNYEEIAAMTAIRSRWLEQCLGLFCEDLALDIEQNVTNPKRFSSVLTEIASDRTRFVINDQTSELVDFVIDRVVQTEQALINKLRAASKDEDVGQNLDTELVQEAEQEQEAIQQTASGGDGKPQFAKKIDKINRWRVTDLSSAAGMLDNNFYPLGKLDEVTPLKYPSYVLLSQNYLPSINKEIFRRRLKNVYVVCHWIPKHDNYDPEDNTEQLLALLEGEYLNPAQVLRFFMDDGDATITNNRKTKIQLGECDPAAKAAPYVVALSLEEAETLRRVVQAFMGPNAPALGDRPLLQGTKVKLASLNGLWLTGDDDEKVEVDISNQLFLEAGHVPSNFNLGRNCLRFFNCSLDLSKDDVILLIHALEGQSKESRKKSYGQVIEGRRRVRKNCLGTHLELAFENDDWLELAEVRDFSIEVRESMLANHMNFEDIDANKDNLVSITEFSTALMSLPGIKATEAKVRRLVKYVDENDYGYMNYREFCAIFLGLENLAEAAGSHMEDDEGDAEVEVAKHQEEVSTELASGVTTETSEDAAKKAGGNKPKTSSQALSADAMLLNAPKTDIGPKGAHDIWDWTSEVGQAYLRSGGSACLGFDDLLTAPPDGGRLTVAMRGIKLYQHQYYFELRVAQPGSACVGVIDETFVADHAAGQGVGEGFGSWGYDGHKGCIMVGGERTDCKLTWAQGDVIGVKIDLLNNQLIFSINGVADSRLRLAPGALNFRGSVCPAVSFEKGFSGYLNIGGKPFMHRPGQGMHDHSKKIQPKKVFSVHDWVKIKLETIFALETGYFFGENKEFQLLMNTKKNYEITVNKVVDFRHAIMLEGNWYYEFTLIKGTFDKTKFSMGLQVSNTPNSNGWNVAEYFNSEVRSTFTNEGSVKATFDVRDTIGIGYNCSGRFVFMTCNGRWVKKSYYNQKHDVFHGHKPLFNILQPFTATISLNFGESPFKYCPPDYLCFRDWVQRVDIFKSDNAEDDGADEKTADDEKAEEVDEYEALEAKLEEERAEEAVRKTHVVSTGGGQQIRLECLTGQNAITLSPTYNEEAMTKLQVTTAVAYPSVIAPDVYLTTGKWYYEVTLESVSSTFDRAVVGWAHANFSPDSLQAVGVGDLEYTWGIQLKTQRPAIPSQSVLDLFKLNERDIKTEEEKRKEIEKARVQEVPDYVNFEDDDDEVKATIHVQTETKEEVKQVEAPEEKVSKGSLIWNEEDWKVRDVIGCAIDFNNSVMSFSRNGEWNSRWRIKFSTQGLANKALRPAFSMSSSFRVVDVFFGNIDNLAKQFRHPPPEFHFPLNLCFDARILAHFSKTDEKAEFKISDKNRDKKTTTTTAAVAATTATVEMKEEEVIEIVDEEAETDFSWYVDGVSELKESRDLILWDRPRKNRKKWASYLKEVSKIEAVEDTSARTPHLSIFGDILAKAPQFGRKLMTFLSSTFTDTQLERNLLITDVYPYLRELALLAGFEFAALEMRWGIRELQSEAHETYQICMDEITRCLHESRGIAFVSILGDKYGYRPFPASIAVDEYKVLFAAVSVDIQHLLSEWFELDTSIPAYSLRALIGELKSQWLSDDGTKGVFLTLQRALREVAPSVLSAEDARRYVMSVTEAEISRGILAMNSRNELTKSFCFSRKFNSVPPFDEQSGKFKDTENDAQEHLRDLRERVAAKFASFNLATRFKEYSLDYEMHKGLSVEKHKVYLRQFSNFFCQLMSESLLVAAKRHAQLAADPLLEEVSTHNALAIRKTQNFTGREAELAAIKAYITSTSRQPFIVCGNSGSGKTALMAQAALMCSEIREFFMIVRFVGTSMRSSTVSELLRNLCIHLGRIYGQSNANLPSSYSTLKTTLKMRMTFPTTYCPLVIFLDSLDQLTDEDQGRELKWLPKKLPKNLRLIVSCIGEEPQYMGTPTTAPYRALMARNYPETSWLRLTPMSPMHSTLMLDNWLTSAKRTLTKPQRDLLLSAFNTGEKSRLPLYLRLAFDVTRTWKSSEILPRSLPKDITELILHIFRRLETKHGKVAPAALSYITCTKYGLSANELIDVLSLDDEVLDDVFQHWSSPIRRLPAVIWVRLRADISEYLVERGAQGLTVFNWFHRQFKEVVKVLWLSERSVFEQRSLLIADYFSGKYAKGKIVECGPQKSDVAVDRRINPQSLMMSRTKLSVRYNRRRLEELPHALTHARQWQRLADTLCSFEFITAKCEVSSVSQLVSDFVECINSMQAIKATEDLDEASEGALKILQEFKGFLVQYAGFIGLQPRIVYNLARNMPDNTSPCKGAVSWYEGLDEKRRLPWLRQLYKPQALYPGVTELQMNGFLSSVAMGPQNDRFATCCGVDQVVLKIYATEDFEEVAEYKFSRNPKMIENIEDPIQNFYNYEDMDWYGDRIVLMLDTVSVINATNGTVILSCPPSGFKLVKCRFSKDGSRIVAQGDGALVIYDAGTGQVLNEWDNVVYGALSGSMKSLAIVEKPKPTEGDDVRCGWRSGVGRFPGWIVADNKDGTYFVQFTDGDYDREAPEAWIDLLKEQSSLKIIDATKTNEIHRKADNNNKKEESSWQTSGGWSAWGGGVWGGGGGTMTVQKTKGGLDRYGRVPRETLKKPEALQNAGSKKDVGAYTDFTISLSWNNEGTSLAAILPSGEVYCYNLEEKKEGGPALNKIQFTKELVVPGKPMSCTYSADDKWLFVLTASTFHFIEASSGLVSGHVTQDYMRSVLNAKMTHDCRYMISAGGVNRMLKLWDLSVAWDRTSGSELQARIDSEVTTEKYAAEAKAEALIQQDLENEKAGKKKEKRKHEDIEYVSLQRCIGNALELDVDAQWTPNGKHLVFLTIDLRGNSPVSCIKMLSLSDLEQKATEDGKFPVTVKLFKLPVPEAQDPTVTITSRGIEKIQESEEVSTSRANTATTSSIVTRKVRTVTTTITTVDRAPSMLAWAPDDKLHVIAGVAYLGIPRPLTNKVEIGLELRKRDGTVIKALKTESGYNADPLTIKFSPNSHFLAGAYDFGQSIMVWQMLDADKQRTTLSGGGGMVQDFCFSKDSQNMLILTSSSLVYMKVSGASNLATNTIKNAGLCCAMSHEPHDYVAVGTDTGAILLFTLKMQASTGRLVLTQFQTWQAYGSEHTSQKVFGVGFIRNTGILVTIGDSVIKVWSCGSATTKPKELNRYYARFLLSKMSISKDGVIALFGKRGIEPLILRPENLDNYITEYVAPLPT